MKAPAESSGFELDSPDPSLDLPSPAERAELPNVRSPAAPARPAPAQPPAARPAPAQPSAPSFDLDLPSIADSVPPALGGARAATPAAAPVSASGGFGEIELDLPSASPELPAMRARSASAPELAPRMAPPGDDIGLPGVVGAGLPSRAGRDASRSPTAVDLPARAGVGLPSAGGALDLPSPSIGGAFDLPSPSLDSLSLPSPSGAALPSLGGAGLPNPSGAGLPSTGAASLPARNAPSLPAPFGEPLDLDAPRESGRPAAFGMLDLEPVSPAARGPSAAPPRADESLEADLFGEAPLPPPRSLRDPSLPPPAAAGMPAAAAPFVPTPEAAGNPVIRETGGGVAYGEVNLGGDDDGMALDATSPARAAMPSEEDMEFDAVPQERASARPGPMSARTAATAAVALPAPSPAEPEVKVPRARGKLPVRSLAAVFVVLVGGASLAFVKDAGPFGSYWIIDRVRATDYERLGLDTAKKARAKLSADVAPAAALAAAEVDRARAEAKRVPGLTAYAAVVASIRELRFGPDPEVHARAKVLLDEIAGRDGVPNLELARAARAAAEGQLARARQGLAALLKRAPNDIDALVVSGEVELKARDAASALTVWQTLAKLEPSARAAFGLSRSRYSAGDVAGAEREAKVALERNAEHVGAKILLARVAAATTGREGEAITWLDDVKKGAGRASADERVSAHTLLGDIHLQRSRISRAEEAYAEALKINPKAARALTGLGEALYRAGRYSEAQARFEAGAQADPDDVFAKVGVAKSKLMLERLEDAQASLKRLRESHPSSLLVAYWFGRVLEALGDRAQAEQIYRKGIDDHKQDPLLVDTYVALALVQNQQGRAEDAQKTLALAKERLPASAAIHRAVGDVALSQGRYAEAETELRRALELDSEDLGARFRLGSTLRRNSKFDEAGAVFDEVAKVDADYPGLALERGLLFEASGRTEEALKAYEGALAKAPEDPDLMLRVGCGYASAARTKEAEQLLRKVLSQRPTSAETNHCLGRALLAEGSRLADALRALERAVELDPHRAEFHLYVGWAANEAGNVLKAQRELDLAIQLDQGLADAYWQRGVLRQRQGAVRDALADLLRALQLRPTRHEAHAALADVYYDLGREQLALAEWQKAVAAQPENATWRFRYAKLLDDNRMSEQAKSELARALALAGKKEGVERWTWDANLRLARLLGQNPDAAQHWEAFLRLGPLDSPYRAEAMAALEKLGRPYRNDGLGLAPKR